MEGDVPSDPKVLHTLPHALRQQIEEAEDEEVRVLILPMQHIEKRDVSVPFTRGVVDQVTT